MTTPSESKSIQSHKTPPSPGSHTVKSQRTLLASLLMSSPGPILTGIAAATSQSATQLADFIRRTLELIALFVAWWVYRKRQTIQNDEVLRLRLERSAGLTVTISMACSAVAMLIVGINHLFTFQVSGNVTMGLVIAILGVVANTIFWWRYRSFSRRKFDPVIAGQQRLYLAKTWIDLCVVFALSTVAFFPNHPLTRYVDALGSIVVSGYLFYQAIDAARKNSPTPGSEV